MIAVRDSYTIYVLACAVALTGCQRSPDEATNSAAETPLTQQMTATTSDKLPSSPDRRTVITSGTDVPYPVYPNATQYRAGSENGLEVVLFQTNDGFEKVDEFYQRMANGNDMPRLAAMKDYVRFTLATDETDAWDTSTPGIVIHRFNDDTERAAVGADSEAVTNIIMSF